jgi:glutamate-ammonia-ligase adenylyltransferase
MASVAGRSESAADAVNAIRSIRQRELIRIACADLLDVIDVQQVGAALSDLADATLQISLEAVLENFWTDREKSLEIALIGLGRLGGRELNYRSDADVCFVYAPINEHPKAGSDAVMIISQLQQLLAQPGNDPSFELDMDLRPEGRQGAVVRTLDSYAAYYQRWSLTWESQALLRARAIAGDPTLGDQFISMIDALRYPEGGLSAEQLRDIRRIKARVESERLPRGVDPALHVKLGPGGISDVEWTVQLLQLQHAQEITSLQTTETLSGLKAAEQAGLISDEDREILTAAWLEASDIRNVMTLSHSGTGDSIPTQPEVARLVGYIHGRVSAAVLVENYRRLTRRARAVMERHVYGTVIEEQYP